MASETRSQWHSMRQQSAMQPGLARISHHPSAASAYLTPSQGLPLHAVLDVLPSTSASPALREALDLIRRTANALATKAGERPGLAAGW